MLQLRHLHDENLRLRAQTRRAQEDLPHRYDLRGLVYASSQLQSVQAKFTSGGTTWNGRKITYHWTGGRIDYVAGRTVAAVVYARRQHMINVFSWPTAEASALAPSSSSEKGYHLVHWRNAGIEMWAVSDLNPAELQQFVIAFERSDSGSGR